MFVLETEISGGIRRTLLRPSDEEVYGLSADQILTSGHFGLASARDPEFTRHLQEQARAASRGNADAAIHFMRLMALGDAAEGEAPTASSAGKAKATKKPAKASRAGKKK